NHRRYRYNLPLTNEIAVILSRDGSKLSSVRDIIVYLKAEQGLMRISECHPAYLPLHYVLLFPTRQLGWSIHLKHWNVARNTWYSFGKGLTQMEYYCYRLFERPTEYSPILRAGKLFQQFIVYAWASTEQNRLRYVNDNQGDLRSDLYGGLTDIVTDGLQPEQVGQRVILPSSQCKEYV
ncbi:hypothetical protein GIB67_011335, partial [Kingdonia uniflora]